MFVYEKKLQYPVRIANPNPKLAAFIISQYGGPDGKKIYISKEHPAKAVQLLRVQPISRLDTAACVAYNEHRKRALRQAVSSGKLKVQS